MFTFGNAQERSREKLNAPAIVSTYEYAPIVVEIF